MDVLLMVVLIGIAVAGLAAVVAIWVERDRARPRKFAWALSILILLATGVTILQSILQDKQDKIEQAEDEAEKDKLRGDMARMMQTLDKIAAESDDPQLAQFLSTEIEAQSRANPQVVQKLAQRYADEGEDPAQKLAKHLPKSEVQKMARSGAIKTAPSAVKIEKKEPRGDAPPRLPRPGIRPPPPAGDGEEGAAGAAAPGEGEAATGEAPREGGRPGALRPPGPPTGPGLGGAPPATKGGDKEGDKAGAGGTALGGKKPGAGALPKPGAKPKSDGPR